MLGTRSGVKVDHVVQKHENGVCLQAHAFSVQAIKMSENHQNKEFQQAHKKYEGGGRRPPPYILSVPAGIPYFDGFLTFLMACTENACACRHTPFSWFVTHGPP